MRGVLILRRENHLPSSLLGNTDMYITSFDSPISAC